MSFAFFSAARWRTETWLRVLLLTGVFLAIVGAKYRLIDRYGVNLPFWDQWEAEADMLYRPFLASGVQSIPFTHAHNEHRIVATLVWSLGLFLGNDRQWDPTLEMAANALLHAALAVALVAFAMRLVGLRLAALLAIPVVVLWSTSAAWENTVAGFQSQFYFLLLFSGLHVALALGRPAYSLGWWLAPLAGIAAIGSMGAGILSSAVVFGLWTLQALRDRRWSWRDGTYLGIHAVLFIWGRWLQTEVPNTAHLKAQGFGPWLDAWLHQLSWPITRGGFPWFCGLGLVPPLWLLLAYWRRKVSGPLGLMLLGASAWGVAETAAMAYARGGMGYGFGSRYVDLSAAIFAVNLLTLAYLASLAPTRPGRWAFAGGAIVAVGIGAFGLRAEERQADVLFLQHLPQYNAARIATVRSWIKHRDPAFFKKEPFKELPYPEPEYLSRLLNEPHIRQTLPSAVRPPPAFVGPVTDPTHFEPYRVASDGPGPAPWELAAWETRANVAASFSSGAFEVDRNLVSVFVASHGNPIVDLWLVDAGGGKVVRLDGGSLVSSGWKRVNFSVSPGRYRLFVEKGEAGWIAFSQPQTDTRLSRLVDAGVRSGRALQWTGATLGLPALLLASLGLRRKKAVAATQSVEIFVRR